MDIEEQYDKIYQYCYFRLRSRQAAEDITQETFLRYLEKYQCTAAKKALNCLYTIARNLCVDEYRR
ncbi:MAG: RNA polymerase subunit sigma-24, partial [Lachnospiraceae bacterium]|nr:RNA polymerase subunit sigma-24 [Lachnospiraceae bacterium]